jgi:hypothetical protein
MLIYDKIRSQVTTLSILGEPLPITYTMSFGMIYLGKVTSLLDIELKHTRDELGWLYQTAAIVVFEFEGVLYESWLSKIKEYVEDLFQNKMFLAPGEPPMHGFIQRTTKAGLIIANVYTSEIIKLSKQIPG